MSRLLSLFIPLFPSSTMSISPFSLSASLFFPCKQIHQYLFSRFHIYASICYTCFSLSDLLNSIQLTSGSSTSLELTQIYSFLWLSNIPLYICTTTSVSIHLLMDIQIGSCPSYSKQGCYEFWGTCVFFNYGFVRYMPLSGSYDSFIPSFLRNLLTVLHRGCINLHSPHKFKKVPLSSHPLQKLLLVDFFDDSHSDQCGVISHCTGRPGVLQFMELQRIRYDWTE